ncbi:MAG TPA: hypothetical protein VFR81_11770 [Longimicrobium sp.]|nr:hypothetical protein [Longimicrobium sp.]
MMIYDEVETPDDGIWTADDEIQGRSCPLVIYREVTGTVVLGGGERARFGFMGRKPRVRYVYVPGSTLPAADYLHFRDELSDDARWIATAGGTITVWRCYGRFYRLPGARIWKGTYWMYTYDGEIRAGPNYQGPQCGGGSGAGGDDTRLIEEVHYDPYDPAMSMSADDGGGDCGSGGGGTQYQPGDYTGGETVDWGTGEGNGGTSACGDQAMVEYVCIDVYNEETGSWEEWGCGYVTTC